MWQEIKKFSPKYSDLPIMIHNVNVLLRITALNVDSRVNTPIPLTFYLLTASCAISYYYAYVFSMLWFVFYRCPQTGDLTAAMIAGSLGISSQISTFKLFYMIFNASKVRCLVEQCLETDALSVPNRRFSKYIRKVLRNVKIRAISFFIGIMTIVIVYNTIPMLLSERHLPEDRQVFYGLEPAFETPYYQISYFLVTFSTTFICYTCSTISAFMIVIMGYIEAQMFSLSEEITCVWEDSIQDTISFDIEYLCALYEAGIPILKSDTITRINQGVRKRLILISQIHSRNVTLLRNIDAFLNFPNAFAFGCLGVSLTAELLGGLENTYLQIPFTFSQVALDCFTGQKIMDASLAFERAVYGCKWENFDKDNKRIVLMMLRNSQKTLTISAGGMAVLNFGCLMSIVRSVYSTYTTLRSMI